MKLFGKVCKVLKEQGVASLTYVISEKLKNKMSEQQKYAGHLKNERRRKALLFSETEDFSGMFTIVVPNEDVFSFLEEVKTPYVAFLEEGDHLEKGWQQQAGAFLKNHPQCKLLYSDEQLVEGKKRIPVYKPDWSPDTYMCYDYVGGLLIMERELAVAVKEQIHGKYKESFLYELGLRGAFSLQPDEVGHLNWILYHRYVKKRVPKEQLVSLKEEILKARGLRGKVIWRDFGSNPEEKQPLMELDSPTSATGCADVIYETLGEPTVSIVVPSKDHWQLLKACVESVEKYTTYPNVQWIIVDNGSDEENKKKYQEICENTRFPSKYLYKSMEFNFSRMCNIGAKAATGEYLLFLNDDMELIPNQSKEEFQGNSSEITQTDWLGRLLGQAALPHSGAVGAKLLYPDSKMIQHLGVVNYTSGAAHLLWQEDDGKVLPYARNHTTQNYSIVTGACLLVNREKFWQVGGFEERLAVTFNDVELCLKLLEAGYYQSVRTDVVLYHHESISRGQDVLDEKKFLRGLKEREVMFDLHPKFIGVDPFYNKELTQTRLDHTLDYPVKYQLSKQQPITAGARSENIVYRILRVTLEEDLFIEGWAYRKGRGYEPVRVLLTDESGKAKAFATRKVYTPTITQEQQSNQNLNFAGFECRIARKDLQGKNYKIALQIADEIVDIK